MQELERRRFELHARKGDYQTRIQRAREYLATTTSRYEAPCLHVSGGKDSLVLWHLVMQSDAMKWPVFHFDNGLLNVPGVTDFVKDMADEWETDLYVRTSAAANDERMIFEEGHGYRGYWGTYKTLLEQHDWDCRVLGIRAAESPQRRDRFDGTPPTDHSHGVAAAPIHHLTTADVWAYIVDHELPYHEIYDRQGDLYGGIDAPENRLVTLYDSEFDSLGAREISQFIYPGETNALKDIEQRGE